MTPQVMQMPSDDAVCELAARHGRSAAESWFAENIAGNVGGWMNLVTGQVTAVPAARYVLDGLDGGVEEIVDSLPWLDLSGQWADGPSPRSIIAELGGDPEIDLEVMDEIVDVYETAYDEAVVDRVMELCREAVE